MTGSSGSFASYDTFEHYNPLDAFFMPKNVAVIGASDAPDSIGRTALWNLMSSPFGGTIYPVNNKRASVLGIKAYSNLRDIPTKIDLALIATPAITVIENIRECVETGVRNAIIVSAGFKERGEEGLELERQILQEAHKGKLRLLGPNSMGIVCPATGLNASCTKHTTMPARGNVGFISQSAALCAAVLDWSLSENVGFSAVISVGSMLDIGWGELISFLGNDSNTRSIVIYMETIDNVRSFLSAAREVALTKPVIVMKAGHSEMATRVAASHTGALTTADEILDAAFRRTGVLRVNRVSELFDMAEALSKQPRPRGPRLTIVTNAGAAGILATDTVISNKGKLAPLSEAKKLQLNTFLPPHWSHTNPLDIIGDASPERYAKTLEVIMNDPESDGLLVVLTPQPGTDPTATARVVTQQAKKSLVPVLASWMGGSQVDDGVQILNSSGIPTYPYPDTAARIFTYMWNYTRNLRNIYETPLAIPDSLVEEVSGRVEVENIINQARQKRRTILTEVESKQILEAYHIPVVAAFVARNPDEAVTLAEEIGYPVVLKVYSETVTHKAEVGGVRLNLKNEGAVREAYEDIKTSISSQTGAQNFHGVTVQNMVEERGYELIVGSSFDEQFGPVLLFGTGGRMVEIYEDRVISLPPLNTTLARRMMENTRIFAALENKGGQMRANIADLEMLMVRFSRLAVEQRWIREIDINPVLALPDKIIALDARIILHDPDVTEEKLPTMAIRPYPVQYVQEWTMKDGNQVIIRPIRPEDEPLIVKYHETLSDRSVYFRYLHMLSLNQRTEHERLTRICFIDYDREMALVVEQTNADTDEREILGVGRLNKLHGSNEAEFAILISDKAQGKGLGKKLLLDLIQIGRDEKLSRILGYIHPENMDMQRVCERVGFKRRYSLEEGLIEVRYDLK
jgi:acetyltransferase